MRILHIMASKALGGAETYSTDVMLSLHQQGIDQCVVMRKDAPRYGEMKRTGMRLRSFPLAIGIPPLQRVLIRLLIGREKPDIIHTWMRRGAALAPKKNAAPNNRAPCIIGWFGGYYDVAKFQNCDHLVGVTQDIVEHMVKSGFPRDCAHFIPTFPDIPALPPVDRLALTTPREAKVLLTLSRLHPKKGLDTMLEALKNMPECVLWMAGDGPLRHELEQLAQKLGVVDRVRFLGWRTDRTALLRAADICVLPSRYEPFGTVILEAWAAGTPLVACASAGPSAHIENNVNGILTPIDDVDALAIALRRVLKDGDLRRRLVAHGYAAYIKGFTRETVTQQWIKFYKSLIKL